MTSPAFDVEKDAQEALDFISKHELCDEITKLFMDGPAENSGWVWTTSGDAAFTAIEHKVLCMGYDSSGYAMMMRKIEHAIKTRDSTPWEDQLPTKIAAPSGGYKTVESMQPLFKSAVSGMDDNNREAANVWDQKGTGAAVKYMFEQAGGDYSTMRSMFG
jgi:hypothetical protein